MALKLEEKKVVVAEVNAVAAKALSVVGAENRGLTVTQMTDLRAKARKEGVYLRIVKNTLARKAVAGTTFECISPALKGPDCPGIFQRRSRRGGAHRQGICQGQRQAGDDDWCPWADSCSRPIRSSAWRHCRRARRRCRSCWVCMKAPIAKFVGTLAAPNSKLVRTLAAVLEAKKSGVRRRTN